MGTRRTYVLAAAVAATAALASAAGCGGSSGSEAQKAVVDAAATTTNVTSYRTAVRTTFDLVGRSVTVTGEGAFAPKRNRGTMTLDMSDLSTILRRRVGKAHLVLAGRALYMRLPFLKTPKHKPWLKIASGGSGQAGGVDFSSLLQLGQGGDPTQTLGYLAATEDVKKLGEEKVRGTPTTHYRGTVALAKVAKHASPRARARTGLVVARLIALMRSNKLPVDVWIDHSGRVRRVDYRETLRLQLRPTTIRSSTELFDFGTPVVAPVPPASQVTDFTKLARKRKTR